MPENKAKPAAKRAPRAAKKRKTTKKKVSPDAVVQDTGDQYYTITLYDITNALWGIESWCRSVRSALRFLDPTAKVKVPMSSSDSSSGSGTGRPPTLIPPGCEPPTSDSSQPAASSLQVVPPGCEPPTSDSSQPAASALQVVPPGCEPPSTTGSQRKTRKRQKRSPAPRKGY